MQLSIGCVQCWWKWEKFFFMVYGLWWFTGLFVVLISCLISQRTNFSSTGFTIKGRAVNISLRIYWQQWYENEEAGLLIIALMVECSVRKPLTPRTLGRSRGNGEIQKESRGKGRMAAEKIVRRVLKPEEAWLRLAPGTLPDSFTK